MPMSLSIIDKLLNRSFQRAPDYARLNQLESDVWRKIRQSKAAKNTVSFMMPVWSNTRLRYASLSLALIGGLILSQSSIQPIAPTDTLLGLDVFAPDAAFLMTLNYTI